MYMALMVIPKLLKRTKVITNRSYMSRTDCLLKTFQNHIADTFINKVKGDGISLRSLVRKHGKSINTIHRWIKNRRAELNEHSRTTKD